MLRNKVDFPILAKAQSICQGDSRQGCIFSVHKSGSYFLGDSSGGGEWQGGLSVHYTESSEFESLSLVCII